MKISKMIIALSAIFAVSAANADYTVKIPLELSAGGRLPNNSIIISEGGSGNIGGENGGETSNPTEPEVPANAKLLTSQSYVVEYNSGSELYNGNTYGYLQFIQKYHSMVATVPYETGLDSAKVMRTGSYKCPITGSFMANDGDRDYIAFECGGDLLPQSTPIKTSFKVDFWTE